jgi:hypothetical protein
MSEPVVHIRSHRNVFRTDWRITRVLGIDFTRLWPGGLPAIPVGIAVVGLFVMWIVSHFPLVGLVPGIIRYAAIPVLVALVARLESPDGRSQVGYGAARTGVLWRQARRLLAPAAAGGDVCVRWDVSASKVKRVTAYGPVRADFARPVRFAGGGDRLVAVASDDGRPGPVVLCPGARLEVRA